MTRAVMAASRWNFTPAPHAPVYSPGVLDNLSTVREKGFEHHQPDCGTGASVAELLANGREGAGGYMRQNSASLVLSLLLLLGLALSALPSPSADTGRHGGHKSFFDVLEQVAMG